MSSEGCRSEWKWRLVREGEVSPFKVLLTLFIRENYATDLRKNPHDDGRPVSTPALLLIYKLMTSNDMSYSVLKELIESPRHKVRPEVLKRFFRILSNLEASNSYFLYELAHSIISIEPSQTVILKKRIGKNSPIGRFLRNVYMNIRRLSYPQVHFLYNQLTTFLNIFPKSFAADVPLQPLSATFSSSKLNSDSKKGKEEAGMKFRGLEIFQRLSHPLNEPRNRLGLDLFSQYVVEYRKVAGVISQEDDFLHSKSLAEKKLRVQRAIESSKSLRDLWQPKFVPKEDLGTTDRTEVEDFFSLGRGKRRSSSRKAITPFTPPSKTSARGSPRKGRASATTTTALVPQEFTILEEGENGYFLFDDPPPPNEATTPTKSPGKSPFKGGKRKMSLILTPVKEKVQSVLPLSVPVKEENKSMEIVEIPPSQRWKDVKWWSRRQVEKVVKALASKMYHTHSDLPSPKEISEFIEAIIRNPSAQVLLPQLHFLEYLNGLRVKDLGRCSESLRTSFDIRVKPNTSELNKGTPYAAYNFALFYNLLGYKEDALGNLEEAFRAGHAAGDATCLHYCHNLWSNFHNKPYMDAIVTVTKEVDNNMAYLHSINVIANAFDYHYQRLPTEEVLYTLWHYNAECDLEEMEALLLTSLGSFFTVFGWHEMISFPSQMILNTKLKWPSRAYCFALSSLSQSLLFHGDVEVPFALMEYGKELFGTDASPAGELFALQHAVFQSLYAYLGYRPLNPDVIATIAAFNPMEALYWQAYSKLIGCDWEEAGRILNKLWLSFDQTSYEINDMKIRCLLMQAELECLCRVGGGALSYLSEALELAYSLYSDLYVTLILSHIASIQCEMGLLTTASRTMYKDMRASIRCSSPWLKARLNLVNVKLSMRLQKTIPKANLTALMEKLDWSEDLYSKWGNNYRLKEVLDLKTELLDRSEDLTENGNAFRKKLSALDSSLPWSPSTCLI